MKDIVSKVGKKTVVDNNNKFKSFEFQPPILIPDLTIDVAIQGGNKKKSKVQGRLFKRKSIIAKSRFLRRTSKDKTKKLSPLINDQHILNNDS